MTSTQGAINSHARIITLMPGTALASHMCNELKIARNGLVCVMIDLMPLSYAKCRFTGHPKPTRSMLQSIDVLVHMYTCINVCITLSHGPAVFVCQKRASFFKYSRHRPTVS